MENALDNRRGIKNAGARYEDHAESRLLASQIYERAGKKSKKRVVGSGQVVSVGQNRVKETAYVKDVESKMHELYGKMEMDYTDGDVALLISNPPQKPSFPIGMFSLAIMKDVLDAFLGITVVLSLFIFVITIPVMVILAYYFFGRVGGAWWKKKLIKGLWIKYLGASLIEILPFISMIPATTILVLMAHNSETKFVKGLNLALEKLH